MTRTRSFPASALLRVVSATTILGQAPTYPTDRVLTHREQAPLVKALDPEALRHRAPGADAAREDRHVDHRVARVQRRPGVSLDGAADDLLVAAPHDPRRSANGAAPSIASRSAASTTTGSSRSCRPRNDEQWDGLRKLVEERDPQVIGINTSEAWNHADGLTANEKEQLLKALGPEVLGAREVGRDARGRLARDEDARRDRRPTAT